MKTIVYYVVTCGATISRQSWPTREQAQKQADAYHAMTGWHWSVRMMVGTVADD